MNVNTNVNLCFHVAICTFNSLIFPLRVCLNNLACDAGVLRERGGDAKTRGRRERIAFCLPSSPPSSVPIPNACYVSLANLKVSSSSRHFASTFPYPCFPISPFSFNKNKLLEKKGNCRYDACGVLVNKLLSIFHS